MRSYVVLAAWTFLAGAGIPFIGVLNGGLARSVGNPVAATAVMFAIALIVALGITVSLYGLPSIAQLRAAPPLGYAAGLLIGFYALSATVIIPRMGAASFISFILIAQIITSAVIDQFGLFGLPKRPLDAFKLAGIAVMIAGVALLEIGNSRRPS